MSISIIIPTHSRGEQVLGAVESVISSVPIDDVEIIVVEDRTNQAYGALLDYISSGRVKYYHKSEGPHGAAATRNFGVNQASHSHVLFLDDDDIFNHQYISILLSYLKSPTARWGFCNQEINGNLKRSKVRVSKILDHGGLKDKIAAASAGLWIEKSLFLEVKGFDVDQLVDEDTDLCCRLLGKNIFPYYIAFPGVRLSRGDGLDRLTSSIDYSKIAKCYKKTLDKNIDNFRHDRDAYEYLVDRAHRAACKSGDLSLVSQVRLFGDRFSIRFIWWLREIKYFGFVYRLRF